MSRNEFESREMDADESDIFALKTGEESVRASEPQVHLIRRGVICRTDYRARRRSRAEIVVEATEGFIPLWAENLVLRWRFNEVSLSVFQNPDAVKSKVRTLLASAIALWDDAVPIRFTENSDNSDFQIVMQKSEDCTPQGCTLAQAFFPDAGRHKLLIFPTMFSQSKKEQMETLAHEIGHVFGLRHFFAPENEAQWPSVVFGEHKPFSIMNYGDDSELTSADRDDLKLLYEGAWSGKLKEINGTPIKLVQPYHYFHT